MTATVRLPHVLRPLRDSDRHFVARAWASEMRHSHFSRHVPNEIYWPSMHALISRALDSATTLVAVDPESDDSLYGCICFQPGPLPIVHWVYTKGAFRRLGLAKSLLEAAVGLTKSGPIYATQASELFQREPGLLKKYSVIYDPFLLWGIAPPQPTEISHDRNEPAPDPQA